MLFKTPCCIPSTYSPSQGKPPHHHHPPPTLKICYQKAHNLAMVLRTGWTGEWSSANWRKRSKTTALRLNYDWKWMIPEKNDAIECLWKEVFDNKYDADDDDNGNGDNDDKNRSKPRHPATHPRWESSVVRDWESWLQWLNNRWVTVGWFCVQFIFQFFLYVIFVSKFVYLRLKGIFTGP